MAADTPIILPKRAQEGLIKMYQECQTMFHSNWSFRDTMETIDKEYAREADTSQEHTRAVEANKRGDKSRLQNITIPIVMPQVESAVTYQTSVFLTGTPLFGVSSSAKYIDQALAMETLIDNQALRGGWTTEFQKFFRDGFKYNLCGLECSWEREITAAIETDIGFSATQGKPKEVIWEGNRVKRLDMYNTFFDHRVAPSEMHKYGDFVGYTEFYSRTRLKTLVNTLPNVRLENVHAAFNSPRQGVNGADYNYYVPEISRRALTDPSEYRGTNWLAWAELAKADRNIEYRDGYDVTVLYIRLIPSDLSLNVPARNTPQVWKLIIINHSVILYSERQTNAHGWIPILLGQPLDDGLGFQTKSLSENVQPIQDVTSALSNSNIAARRRAVSDRVLYDPSRITEAQINNSNPSAKIPVRPAAYGKNIAEAVYAFPFRDDQSATINAQLQLYTSMANMISGQNPVRQGQFVKGNKTQSEFDTVMGNANGRDQTTSIALETQIFTPLKHMLLINNLQYQGGTYLYSRDKEMEVNIDPVELRKAVYTFKVSDGLTPTDKLMDTDVSIVAMQQIGTSPQIAAGYNIAQLFSYLMKLKGAQISEFEKPREQQAFEQAYQQWQQMCMQIATQNKEATQASFPPPPKPADFGWNPNPQAPAQEQQEGQQEQEQTTEE